MRGTEIRLLPDFCVKCILDDRNTWRMQLPSLNMGGARIQQPAQILHQVGLMY